MATVAAIRACQQDGGNREIGGMAHGYDRSDHARPLGLNFEGIKQVQEASATPVAASPRPLPPELRYQPQAQCKWRESLNGCYSVTQKSLGEGASGKVILATDRRTGEVVAVKVIPKGRLRPDQLERIRREYSIMNQVTSHKHLIQLIEVVENPHEICIVMEYAPDGDLFSLISDAPEERLLEEHARKIFRQVAKGVSYLHQRGFVHRDIKPENIFMSGGRAILGDFGYGMIYSTTPSSTSVGSLHYASPEVILKENTYIGPEIDVWSLGCVLFAMVCGFTPFQGDTVRDTKLAIVRGHVDYPSFMSEEVKSLVAHMLDLDPKRRYTMEQVLAHPWTLMDKQRQSNRDWSQSDTSTTSDSSVDLSARTDAIGPDLDSALASATPASSAAEGAVPAKNDALSMRALLPRLPLAKLRQLWHSGDKAGGRVSPTSPPSPPQASPSPRSSSPKSSPKASSPLSKKPKGSSGAPASPTKKGPPPPIVERRNTCHELPVQGEPSPRQQAEGHEDAHSPGGSARARRRNTSPRLINLPSPRKALASLTELIMSPRRKHSAASASSSTKTSPSASPRSPLGTLSGPTTPVSTSTSPHPLWFGSDSCSSIPARKKGTGRPRSSTTGSSTDCSATSSANNSPSSSGEHAIFT